jgi:hypothetical protein
MGFYQPVLSLGKSPDSPQMYTLNFTNLSILYYKERKQSKTFLFQIGTALPLMTDPPVICFWKWIGWKDYEVPKKSQFRERFCQNDLLFSPTAGIPNPIPAGPTV